VSAARSPPFVEKRTAGQRGEGAIMRLDQFGDGFIGRFFVGFRTLTFKLGVAESGVRRTADGRDCRQIDVSVDPTAV
jgi:hypothetical protein